MSHFNLIDEPWIPVRFSDGKREEFGIRETLLRAKEIAVIEDPSPLVVAALYRFLLAVLYRALEGPTDIDQAREWFKSGFPAKKITAYLKHSRDRFWLFDEKYPFFQIPDFEPKKWNAWTVLAAEHNTNDAKVLFDHVDVNNPGVIKNAVAVRWLLTAQTFAFTGNSELGYSSFSPSVNAVMVIPLGNNLEDTLMLCLVDQNREIIKSDVPIWETEPVSAEQIKDGIKKGVAGHAQLYTWLSRAIRLREVKDGVAEVAFAAGVKINSKAGNDKDDDKKSTDVAFIDPMVAYYEDRKKGKQQRGFSDRGLWRDFDSLLPDDARYAPLVIEHSTALSRTQRDRFPSSIMVLGLSNVPGQAKINFWRMERFTLPQSLLSERSIRTEIYQLLKDAESAEAALERSLKTFAKLVITKGDRELQADKWTKGKWKPGDISKAIGKMLPDAPSAPALGYWSQLEAAFHNILSSYTLDRDPDDIRLDWLKTVRTALSNAWNQHAASISTNDTWAIRALVRAEGAVGKKIKALNEEIKRYETYRKQQEETA